MSPDIAKCPLGGVGRITSCWEPLDDYLQGDDGGQASGVLS